MNKKDHFGDRMKAYENAYRTYLPRRLPVLIRLDGCHFHTYTKGMEKPYDEGLTLHIWDRRSWGVS
nr:tRNA(His) guanylyltransferase Thg1 family protein [Polycladospora coralii]